MPGLPALDATGAPRMEVRFDVLTAKAQVKGTVRIIVRLKDKKSYGTADEQAHKASIARTQSRVLAALASPTSVRKFATIPYLSMKVDAVALSVLRQSPDVVAVFANR